MTSDALGHATSHVALLGAPVAMMILGLDGELLEVNDTLAELLGRSREDLVGRYLHYLATTPEDTESARAAVEEAAGGTTSGALTQVWPSAEGTVHVRLAWTLHRDADGEPSCLTVICLDETRRVLAERRVALERGPLRAVHASPRPRWTSPAGSSTPTRRSASWSTARWTVSSGATSGSSATGPRAAGPPPWCPGCWPGPSTRSRSSG